MIIEISVAIIAAAFVILVIFLIRALLNITKTTQEMNKVLHSTKKDLDELLKNVNATTIDINHKLHTLNVFFKPLSEHRHDQNIVTDIAECVSDGMLLYHKIKGGIKQYVKTR